MVKLDTLQELARAFKSWYLSRGKQRQGRVIYFPKVILKVSSHCERILATCDCTFAPKYMKHHVCKTEVMPEESDPSALVSLQSC